MYHISGGGYGGHAGGDGLDQRLFDHRHLQRARRSRSQSRSFRCSSGSIRCGRPLAVPGSASRRFRDQLRGRNPARRRGRVVRHGSWAVRTAGRTLGGEDGIARRDPGGSRRRGAPTRCTLPRNRTYRSYAGRHRARRNAGRWRLRAGRRSGISEAVLQRCAHGVLHPRRGDATLFGVVITVRHAGRHDRARPRKLRDQPDRQARHPCHNLRAETDFRQLRESAVYR